MNPLKISIAFGVLWLLAFAWTIALCRAAAKPTPRVPGDEWKQKERWYAD